VNTDLGRIWKEGVGIPKVVSCRDCENHENYIKIDGVRFDVSLESSRQTDGYIL